jgi:competence protein ComEC
MRGQPTSFVPALRAQWIACVMVDVLGLDRLSTAPALLSGFRSVSLGDVECSMISSRLRRAPVLRSETDVMILAHHGADNGFTTKPFLSRLEPSLAICSSNYDNQYDHPRDEIKELLWKQGIALMTTKTGDVVVRSIGDHTGEFLAVNLKSDSEEVSSTKRYVSKKRRLLNMNNDTLRQRYYGRRSFPR